MNGKRSRLALAGVLALALSVTVGLVPLGAAEAADDRASAAKKKKKKKGKTITVTAGPTPIVQGTPQAWGLTQIPLRIGKAGKGKVVSPNSVAITFTASTPAPGGLDDQIYFLSDPNGLTVPLGAPGSQGTSFLGPITFTPDSPNQLCLMPPCPNPLQNVGPPGFVGEVGVHELALFTFRQVRGVWVLTVLDTGGPQGSSATIDADLEILVEIEREELRRRGERKNR